MKRIDLVGQKFSNLTVLKFSHLSKHRYAWWECQCICGNLTKSCGYHLRKGFTKSCGCIREQNVKNQKKGKDSKDWSGYGEISGYIFSCIKHAAKSRKIEFNVTIEYIWELFLKQNRKCALSGIELKFPESKNNKKDRTASLDRIDSNKPYKEGNVQWVHKIVNNMKQGYTQEQFINICKLIANNN